jgi:hypothetical protein
MEWLPSTPLHSVAEITSPQQMKGLIGWLLQLAAQIAFENYRGRLNRVFNVESDQLYGLIKELDDRMRKLKKLVDALLMSGTAQFGIQRSLPSAFCILHSAFCLLHS